MTPRLASETFIEIYDTLPPDAQRALLEGHLVPLLNRAPEESEVILSAAKQLRAKYKDIPKLDLSAKKIEIRGLLDELNRDSKRSFIQERSNKDALMTEVIDSLTDWLNDIWSMVYEFKVNFSLAHACLLFVATALEEISEVHGGCKCAYTNQFISITMKRRSGKPIKTFNLDGAHQLDQVLLWIWRDLFVSLLASDNHRQKGSIPAMLTEIENAQNWRALERLLCGGKNVLTDENDYEEEYETDSGDDDDVEDEHHDEDEYYSDDSDEEYEFNEDICPCNFHAQHWSQRVNTQRLPLRQLVHNQLMARFELMPSLLLHRSLITVTLDADATNLKIQNILSSVATSSSDTFAAAIDIYSIQKNVVTISTLLNSHYHLLRPRDAPILQNAAAVLAQNPPYQAQSLTILEKELMDTIRSIHTGVLPLFSHIEEDAHIHEIGLIAKLRQGSAQRQDRVEQWVDAVITPSTNAPHPMAFAAFMMGLPIGPGMDDADDADPLGYLDQADPDFDDLRDEFKPKMRERFDGWTDAALSMKGGPGILLKVYAQIVALMPFLRVTDAVEEMISRLAEKPSKHYICDALDTVAAFCKIQKKKVAVRAEKKKKAAAAQAAAAALSARQFIVAVSPNNPSASPGSMPFGVGGLEDVD